MATFTFTRSGRLSARAASTIATLASLVFVNPGSAGLPILPPPGDARLVNFDDLNPAPASFAATLALRIRYVAWGINFFAPGSDGGAILDKEDAGCDFNGDDKIVTVDALLILKTAVGAATNPNCPPPN